jgi:hypothetical protein
MKGSSKASPSPSTDAASIGNEWISGHIVHQGVPSELHVRKLPTGFKADGIPFVALAFLEKECDRATAQEVTKTIQARLESESGALLVAVHFLQNGRVYWYAYAATRETLEGLFAILGEKLPLYLGVNEDIGWNEYKFMRNLLGT